MRVLSVKKILVAALAGLAFLAIGFEMGARTVKFSPADSVEFSGAVIGGKILNSKWRM